MKFNDLLPELTVTDLERSKNFYLGLLGFELAYERPEDKFCFLQLGGAQLMLEERNGHWETGELEAPLGRGVNFQIGVDDLMPIYERLQKAGVALFRDLQESSYEVEGENLREREFLVQDPDGYLLRFSMDAGGSNEEEGKDA